MQTRTLDQGGGGGGAGGGHGRGQLPQDGQGVIPQLQKGQLVRPGQKPTHLLFPTGHDGVDSASQRLGQLRQGADLQDIHDRGGSEFGH